jgi:hypothetical protein
MIKNGLEMKKLWPPNRGSRSKKNTNH